MVKRSSWALSLRACRALSLGIICSSSTTTAPNISSGIFTKVHCCLIFSILNSDLTVRFKISVWSMGALRQEATSASSRPHTLRTSSSSPPPTPPPSTTLPVVVVRLLLSPSPSLPVPPPPPPPSSSLFLLLPVSIVKAFPFAVKKSEINLPTAITAVAIGKSQVFFGDQNGAVFLYERRLR